MEKLILSNEENRIIHFGISEVERYITEISDDAWWNVFVYVKKPGIEINHFGETMTKGELLELSQTIKNCKNSDWSIKECISFMEPDYSFDIVRGLCYLNINLSIKTV